MQKIEINLAARKEKEGSTLRIISLALFALSILYALYSFQIYRTNKLEIARYSERLSRAVRGTGASGGGGIKAVEDLKLLKRDIEFINNLISKKSFSWTELLSGLEQSVPNDVHILQISPDFKNGKVAISGAARNMKNVFAMVDAMGASGNFKEVFLLKHAQENKPVGAGGAGMVMFNISASYSTGKGL